MRGHRRLSRPVGRGAASLCIAAWSLAGSASPLHAEPAAPPAEPRAMAEYQSSSLAAFVDFGYGASAVGDTLLGDLGAEHFGVQSFRGRALLLQWDALVAVRAGILGNTHPYTPLTGPRTLVSVEAGYRWLPERRWSFYTGAGLSGDFALLTRPGTDVTQLRTLNDMDGVGGRTADGAVRLDAGVSLLDGARSLLLVAFFQEGLRAPGIYTRGAAFAEGGVAARFDLAFRLTASLEALAGQTGAVADASLGSTDRTIYAGISAMVRRSFSHGMWVAAAGGYSRELDHRAYPGSGRSYDTASAPSFDARFFYAVPIGGPRGPKP